MTAARTTTTSTRMGKGRSKRSSIACKKCHASKIKCDVSIQGSPCSRCKDRGLTDCEPIQSRRGTYDREEWWKKIKAQRESEERERRLALHTEVTADCQTPSSSPSFSDASSTSSMQQQVVELVEDATIYEKPKWDMMFESFLDDKLSDVETTSAPYFGESFPIRFLLENQHSKAGFNRVCRSPDLDDMVGLADHPTHLSAAKIAFLAREGCFTKPDCAVLNRLISTYFGRVHNVLPILKRTEFMRLYRGDKVPWLLLHSVCFAASTHCSPDILCRDCGGNRRDSRMTFYRCAKSLFDFGYEKDKLTLVQSAILLSYWGGQPHNYCNTFSWLNAAVTIAESLGMHLPVAVSDLGHSGRALWRRIWWVLVVRDSFCAALLGKPLRINMSQCFVSHLQLGDFELDTDQIEDSNVHAHGMYVIETTKLSMILRDIVSARSANAVTTLFVATTLRRLENWRASLPSCLKLAPCPTLSGTLNILASALSLMYYHNLIYLHQMALPSVISPAVTRNAVSQIVEIGLHLVTRCQIADVPQDAFGSFFMAMVLLFIFLLMKTGDTTLHQFQLRVCEMVVYQAQDYWDHADWILPLSDGLRQKLDAAVRPEATSKQTTKTIDSSMDNIALASLFNILGMHVTPATVHNTENEVDDPVEVAAQRGVLLFAGKTELNVFNEMDNLLADMDTLSSVI
ncbi:fungal-specific transcription factor domain-containing protein [Lipomyces orientalis]|uniref:Fungal-specific transcription factor domain-containing protein n=1 Tax=Lipomyces orientalis TaxID=1233043 RepID=A0ACC3TMF3_9ASCO